ncbi:MAG: chromosome partitioning protein ParA, partial [Rhizobiaceae bacterium]|nr:chromosome partitioning protein ParA [Rhizobiaceae bacterium]
MTVISVCQLKSGGSSTLALTLASVAAAEGRDVLIVDASRNGDLTRWSDLPQRPAGITVVPCKSAADIDRSIRAGKGRSQLVVLDVGTKRERLRVAAGLSDISLIPVRFSPLSAYWASETDRMIRRSAAGPRRRPVFVATA